MEHGCLQPAENKKKQQGTLVLTSEPSADAVSSLQEDEEEVRQQSK